MMDITHLVYFDHMKASPEALAVWMSDCRKYLDLDNEDLHMILIGEDTVERILISRTQ